MVLHVFSENLDEAGPKVTGIPLGINPGEFPGYNGDYLLKKIAGPDKLSSRPLKVLETSRQRDGPQFAERARVLSMCHNEWKDLCVHRSSSKAEFFERLQDFPFVMCVHGGGQDPSPKAWEAIMAGTIPIIQHYPGDHGYNELPVVFVDTWIADVISQTNLRSWMDQLSPFYETPGLRRVVVERLHARYWWAKVDAVLNGRMSNESTLAIESKNVTS